MTKATKKENAAPVAEETVDQNTAEETQETTEQTQENTKESPEKPIGITDIPIPDDVDFRIIIDKAFGGKVKTLVITRTGVPVNFFETIGALQVAQTEAIMQPSNQPHMPPMGAPTVEITLDEIDLEMDLTGQMKKMDLEPGSTIKVSPQEVKLREQVRAAFLAKKEADSTEDSSDVEK